MKIKTVLPVFEPLLLYFVLFMPSILRYGSDDEFFFFTSLPSICSYIIMASVQIIFIIYFISLKNENPVSGNFTLSIIPLSLIYAVVLLITASAAGALLVMTNITAVPAKINAVRRLLPLYLAVSILTGYREELFFRHYLITELGKNIKNFYPVIISSLMFAACHIYQGTAGIIISFLTSIMLSVIFLRHKNIHINALSHTAFNFCILASAVFSS